MTKRHIGYVVVLEEVLREDDAQEIINAIRMIKGVVGVQPVEKDPALEIEVAHRDIAWRAELRRLSTEGPPKVNTRQVSTRPWTSG